MEKADSMKLNMVLRNYKLSSGAVNFPAVLQIPTQDRIYGLVQRMGYQKVHLLLVAAIQLAMESLNVSRPPSPTQIIDLSDALIESAEEDNLGLEDIILFLQKMVRGDFGKVLQMDIPSFMKTFEVYREERHRECIRIREERHIQHKALPVTERFSESSQADDRDAFASALSQYNTENLIKEDMKKHEPQND